MKNFKKIIFIFLSLISLLGCGAKKEATNTSKEDIYQEKITIAQKGETKTLEPNKAADSVSTKIVEIMFEPLIYMDENFELKPLLAEKWERIDNLNVVFYLKKGILFHNGEEMKANDVKYSIERAINTPQSSWLYDSIDKVEIIDDYTVKIKTKYAFGPLLKYLAQVSGAIVNEKAAIESGNNSSQNPVGTGPYKFVEWQPGDKVEFEAFDKYHGGKPKTKYIVFKSIPEANNRLIGLETGELDIAFDISVLDQQVVKDNKDLKLVEKEAPSVMYLVLDQTNPLFQNSKVKQAIVYAINKQEISDVVFKDSAKPASSIIAKAIPVHNPNVEKYEYNIEKSKQLLKEAGFPNGFKTELWVNEESQRVQICTIIQAQLKEVGIDVDLKIFEWGVYLTKTAMPNKPLSFLSWTTPSGDADGLLYPLFDSNNLGSSGNKSYYTSDKFDSVIREARNSIDEEERKKLYYEAQNIIQEDLPAYGIVYLNFNYGAKKTIENAILKKNGFTDLGNVYIKKQP